MAMQQIFLSHSQKDAPIVMTFRNAFAGTDVSPILMEYEKYINPPWQVIKQNIAASSALFVLLSPNLRVSPYTQNWVSYEVGLADQAGREIWVFEDVNNEVIFPLPNAHHYVLYDARQPQSLAYVRNIINSHAFNLGGALLAGLMTYGVTADPIVTLVGALIGSKIGVPAKPIGYKVQCPYANCGLIFQYHNTRDIILCPSCRQPMQVNFP